MRWPLRTEMPWLAAASQDVWVGPLVDPSADPPADPPADQCIPVGRDTFVTDPHASRLIVRWFDDGDVLYHQTDICTWPDGRIERNDFRGTCVNSAAGDRGGTHEPVFSRPPLKKAGSRSIECRRG